MGLFSKPIKTLDDLFVHTLQDIYYAENQITKALPTMIEKATDPRLKQGVPDASERNGRPDHPAGEGVRDARPEGEGRHLRRHGRHPGRSERRSWVT